MRRKNSSKTYLSTILVPLLCVLSVIAGIALGLRSKINVLTNISGVRVNSITYQAFLVSFFVFITWLITYFYTRRNIDDNNKELARKTIRKTFELLKITNRALDNIDSKSNWILNNSPNGSIERALAHEFMQNIRNQVVEIYNGISICIEEWRDILWEEFEEIEKKEQALEKIRLEQIIKVRRLKEYEAEDKTKYEKEITNLKIELARLAEKQRAAHADIISESRKLIGAPITIASNITRLLPPSNLPIEKTVKHPIIVEKSEETNSTNGNIG